MPYDNVTDRTSAEALIPEDVSREIIQNTVDQSGVLSLFRRVNMARGQQRMPVLSAFPTAYFVNGDTGIKQTSEMAWTNKFLNAEEIAVIVPAPENVVDDVDYDLWGEITPRIQEAIARKLDAAVFFGDDAPTTWPSDVFAGTVGAGNVVDLGTGVDVTSDIDEMIGTVEADGFDVNGYFADRRLRSHLRTARAGDAQRLAHVGAGLAEYDGDQIVYGARGLWPQAVGATPGPASTGALAFGGDWSQFVVAIRQDVTFKVLTESVITDSAGAIVYNLPQQDMVALRAKFRVAWQVANPLTHDQTAEADRYPAGAIRTPVPA